jgi:hypothetical protein
MKARRRRIRSPLGTVHVIAPRARKRTSPWVTLCGHLALKSWRWADDGAAVTCEVCSWLMARAELAP